MKLVDFEALFRASPYPHLVMDKQLVIIDVNDAFLNVIGAARPTIIGRYINDILAENSGCLKLINHTEIQHLLDQANHNQANYNKVSTTFMEKEFDVNPIFVIQQTHDTLIQVEAPNKIAHPTAQATHEATDHVENLQLAAQHKDKFLSHISHELRNPVSSINAAAEILSLAKPDPARLQKMTDVIKRQVNLLVDLIDNLSDVSHFATGLVANDLRLLDMKQIVSEAIEHNNSIINARNHTLKLEAPLDDLYILGDHKRMLQVVKNLVCNAAKYTPPGGNILIKLELEKGHVVVNVIDDGNGIAPDLLPKIFDLFGPASQAVDHLNHGLGIGLAVAKSIVETHGGTVHAFSTEGVKGSRFEVRLPSAALVRSQSL